MSAQGGTNVAQPWVRDVTEPKTPKGWPFFRSVFHGLLEFRRSRPTDQGHPFGVSMFDLIRYPGLRECSLSLTFASPWADIGPPLRGYLPRAQAQQISCRTVLGVDGTSNPFIHSRPLGRQTGCRPDKFTCSRL